MPRLLPAGQPLETAKEAITILVADDHELVRKGLRFVFQNTEIKIASEAADEESTTRLVQEQPLDVVLLDIGWCKDGKTAPRGFDILRTIRSLKPDLPVVIYSMHDRQSYKSRCRELGASGYVVKGTSNATLIDAIRKVRAGQEFWDQPR